MKIEDAIERIRYIKDNMKKHPPKRPLNANGVCYTDKLCDIKKDCNKCKNLNPNGTLEDLKSGDRKSIGSWR